MPDPQRLQQLRAQRDLIARHLAWLDQEIAASSTSETAAAPTATSQVDQLPPQLQPAPAPAEPVDSVAQVDTMLDDLLQTEESNEPQLSKTGCWAIFAMIMIVGCGTALWLIYHFWG